MSYVTKRRINFFDCDPAGIMFYGNAFFLAHSAYEEMIESFGVPDYWNSEDYVVPITRAETNYLSPLSEGDEVEIEVTVNELKERSFQLRYTCRTKEGRNAFITTTVHVFTSREFEKIKIPEEIMVKLSEHLTVD
jgi:acyl-CoA thioesterase FadM